MSAPTNETAPSTENARGRESNNTSAVHFPHNEGTHKPLLKWQRVLRALLDRPHTSFDLERAPVFDHVAASTICELKKRGLVIHPQLVRLPGYDGRGVHVAQYTLADESRAKAQQLVGVGQ